MYPYPTYIPPYPYQPQSQYPPNYRAPYGYQAPVSNGPYGAYAPTYPGHVSPTFDDYSGQEFDGMYQGRSVSPSLGSQSQSGLSEQPNSPPPTDGRQGLGSDNGNGDSHQGLSPSQGSTHSTGASASGVDGSAGHGQYGFGSNQISQQATGSQIPMQLGQQPFSFLPHQQLMYQGHDRYNWGS